MGPATTESAAPGVDRRLLVHAGLLGAALVATYLLAVVSAAGQRLDQAALGDISQWTTPRTFEVMSAVQSTASVAMLAATMLAVAAIGIARRRVDLAVAAVVLIAGANLTTQLLKAVLPRPDVGIAPRPIGPVAESFPSGHVTVAIAVGLALTMVVPGRWRHLAAAAGLAYAAAMGVAVVSVGWHRPSDVIGAYLVASAWAALVLAFVRRDPVTWWRPGMAAWGCVSVVPAVGLAATAAATSGFGAISPVDGQAFLVAALCIIAAAAAVVAVFLWLLQGPEPRPSAPA